MGTWFGAWGMQSVLFSWLAAGELRASGWRIALAQSSTMLPSLALILLGGATADRHDPRRLLIRLHVMAAVPTLLLAAAVRAGHLTLPGLITYGLSVGTIAAFVMPARDSLLSRVAGQDMMRAVTGMTAVQFGAQAAGTLAAGMARWSGTVPMLVAQGVLVLLGSALTARLPFAPAAARLGPGTSRLREIREGLTEVARTPALRAPILLSVAVGSLAVGPFFVVFPLLVRDVYQGGVGKLSLLYMLFPVGTVAGSLALRARGGVRRKGRAALVAFFLSSLTVGTIGLGIPFGATAVAVFLWGLTGAVFITSSRTLYQQAAPPAHRARALSVYQLAFLGAAPLGALLAGVLTSRVGPLATLLVFAAAEQLIVVVAWLWTDMARME